MIAASELQLEELITILQVFLIENYPSWLRFNFSRIYHSSFLATDLKEIQKFCNNIIVKHPNLIFESNNFADLPKEALVSIIQGDDLQLEESKIWDHLIKWGIAQNGTLPLNLDDWVDEDFQVLKNTLQQCLPHIRYFQISREKKYIRTNKFLIKS